MEKENLISNEDLKLEEKEENFEIQEEKTDAESRPKGVSEKYSAEEIAELLAEDVAELKEEFRELCDLNDITELANPLRYAALRDLGLTPKEAYLATTPPKQKDNRAHLIGALPRAARSPITSMTQREWQEVRELFEDMSDGEIEKLYRKVTR